MLHRLACRLVGYFMNQKIIDAEEEEVYIYGVELVISTLIGWGVVLLAGGILGAFWFGVLFLLGLVPLRMYCGGYHANSYLKCDLCFLTCFIVNLLLYWWTVSSGLLWLAFVVSGLAVAFICVCAPMEHPNKPFSTQERTRYRHISWSIALIWYAASLLLTLLGWAPALFMSISLILVAGLMIVNLIFRPVASEN